MDEIDASTLNDFLLDNYFHLLAIVILYYDHLLTLGSLYFVVVALSNMINILTFYLTEPAFRGALTTFASCVSVTMMSRLILNLRAADRQTGNSYSTRSLHFARPPRRMYTM
ncbi:hypothetical protein VKT23_011102 [Stygiomarasmius scandens]|uniref:Uncharacterized protein n=1 Tax=Marasmiellus scandens TaxID=2682957 RepID=A0ABR1JAH1_9AGAR